LTKKEVKVDDYKDLEGIGSGGQAGVKLLEINDKESLVIKIYQ